MGDLLVRVPQTTLTLVSCLTLCGSDGRQRGSCKNRRQQRRQTPPASPIEQQGGRAPSRDAKILVGTRSRNPSDSTASTKALSLCRCLNSLPKSALRKMSEHNLTGADLLGVTDECVFTPLAIRLDQWPIQNATIVDHTTCCADISVQNVK